MKRLWILTLVLLLMASMVDAKVPTYWESIAGKPSFPLDAKLLGAVGNGVVDDTVALQAAIDQAVASGVPLLIPQGSYAITAPLEINGQITMFGAGKPKTAGRTGPTIIYADVPMSTILKFGDDESESGAAEASYISDLHLIGDDGVRNADYGIWGAVSHTTFERIRVMNTKVAAFSIFESWDTSFVDCEASYNFGDGFVCAFECNDFDYINCKSFQNEGFGYKIAGLAHTLTGSAVENCLKGGIWVGPGQGYTINGQYFEGCGGIGYTYDFPASYTVHADIICHGAGSSDIIAQAYPVRGLTVNSAFTSSANSQANYRTFLFGAVDGLSINNVECYPATSGAVLNLVSAYAPPTSISRYLVAYPERTNIGFNNPQFNPLYIANAPNFSAYTRFSGLKVAGISAGLPIPEISQPTLYSVIATGTATYIAKASKTEARNPYNAGLPAWKLVWAAGGPSSVIGITVDTSEYLALRGKRVVVGSLRAASNTTNFRWVVSGFGEETGSFAADSNWDYNGMTFIFPASGTFTIGVQGIGNDGGTVFFTQPALFEFGADYEKVLSDQTPFLTYYGHSAPASGSWNLSERVLNSNPEAGEYSGWVCITPGSPGTWKGFGAIEP